MTAQTLKLDVGDIEVTVLDDGSFTLPREYFMNVPEDIAAELPETLSIGANIWFVRTGDRRILVDTGSAEALKQMFPETGQAWDDLLGEDPTDIVLTHMHADHIGGFADGSVFPNAKVHVSRTEWEFWTHPELAQAVPEDQRPMIMMIQQVASGFADRVVLHDDNTELASGVTLQPLAGHTPGHMGLCLNSGGDTLLIIGDAIISETLQFADPDISYALDGDASQAVATRTALLKDCAEKEITIAATHFGFPGVGTVTKDDQRFRFVPA